MRSPVAAQHGLGTSLLERYINHHVASAEKRGVGLQDLVDTSRAIAEGRWQPPKVAGALPPALLLQRAAAAAAAAARVGASAQAFGMLVRNYRSHQRLLELPSRMFYDSSLLACAPADAVKAPAWEQLRVRFARVFALRACAFTCTVFGLCDVWCFGTMRCTQNAQWKRQGEGGGRRGCAHVLVALFIMNSPPLPCRCLCA